MSDHGLDFEPFSVAVLGVADHVGVRSINRSLHVNFLAEVVSLFPFNLVAHVVLDIKLMSLSKTCHPNCEDE